MLSHFERNAGADGLKSHSASICAQCGPYVTRWPHDDLSWCVEQYGLGARVVHGFVARRMSAACQDSFLRYVGELRAMMAICKALWGLTASCETYAP